MGECSEDKYGFEHGVYRYSLKILMGKLTIKQSS